ncbi:hypothetical protein C3489_37300 [Streptomyces sp. Ru71]|uniref:lytic transglycosylase domain-containing protein n=1 Tax=Streptomyces sp. Ru71 TaxID=2080746 RepID=UPI000CDD8565|nr:lytic transglycosylase domain-containing protein [Streptomyces sp. Ru71]POX43942.1 hypothetical protein C3489_37300 [Streptomyces sp. Ru71]
MAGHRARRVRGTALAVAAMTALTASQAAGGTPARSAAPAPPAAAGQGPSVTGDTPYRTDLPPLRTGGHTQAGTPVAALPAGVFAAYRRVEDRLAVEAPGCRLRWQLLAAIGQVESGQARGGRVAPDGTTLTPILGPRLDGVGYARVADTDGGAYDGDPVFDRAVGPMQFIPSTWARWGADGNGDGRRDPDNVYDAALAAGRYLCAGGRDLSVPAQRDRAILGYNHSTAYLRTVLAWYGYFLLGHRVVPDAGWGTAPSARSHPSRPAPKDRPVPRPAPGPSHTPAPSARPGATPSPAPSATGSPAPTGTARATDAPRLPLPGPVTELPGGLLPTGGPLTRNGADTMGAAPSTTVPTER